MQNATVNLPADLLAKARAAVSEEPGETLSGLIGELLRKEIRQREKRRGASYEVTTVRLPAGRPRKVEPGTPLPPRPKPIMTDEELDAELEWLRGRR